MDNKPPSHSIENERRDFFRVEDTALLRLFAIDESSALENKIPASLEQDPSYSLMRELQHIDQENGKLRLVRKIASLRVF